MIAVDSGFLFALADADDRWHARASAAADTVAEGWVTTWAVLAETTHLLAARLGIEFAIGLMEDVVAGAIVVWDPPPLQRATIPALMRKYAKLPMDLADATLVLLAEHLGHGRILTTDQRDFGAYRWKQRKPFHNLLAD
ncbi:type II toxin-antitoxin system VapC family toxin [Aquabacterium humicola]|uniref:type II toxin-antitoxin system VapC family toxin n=1 Tax=Aquabacterium humicola TaxID=3237377 RepID=UPI00254335BE|nr:PIN domain-containing protein [Rubrivivax pictus]